MRRQGFPAQLAMLVHTGLWACQKSRSECLLFLRRQERQCSAPLVELGRVVERSLEHLLVNLELLLEWLLTLVLLA